MVVLARPANEVEAQALVDLLEDEGVPHVVVPYTASAMPGVMLGDGQWGEIRVPAEQVERARELVRALREAAVDDDELERQARAVTFRYRWPR